MIWCFFVLNPVFPVEYVGFDLYLWITQHRPQHAQFCEKALCSTSGMNFLRAFLIVCALMHGSFKIFQFNQFLLNLNEILLFIMYSDNAINPWLVGYTLWVDFVVVVMWIRSGPLLVYKEAPHWLKYWHSPLLQIIVKPGSSHWANLSLGHLGTIIWPTELTDSRQLFSSLKYIQVFAVFYSLFISLSWNCFIC